MTCPGTLRPSEKYVRAAPEAVGPARDPQRRRARMGQHLRGKLGPAGRIELLRLMRDDGLTERAAAAALSVAPSTAHHWSVRERAAGPGERASRSWALD